MPKMTIDIEIKCLRRNEVSMKTDAGILKINSFN